MVPNHLFTLLSMVAMEPPTGFDAAAIRSKKSDVLSAIPTVKPAAVARGQYGAGTILGKKVKAYRQEPHVAPNSKVETYVAMHVAIDNWRWAGVPFYLRTGKHMSQRNTEIAIRFKQAPYAAFQDTPVDALRPNWLVLRIAPDEGTSLQFEVKRRGPVMDLAAVRMDFHYDDWFPKEPNVGYETLIYDVMIGDPTLFMRADMVEQTWRIVQPVLDAWARDDAADLPIYPAGSSALCRGLGNQSIFPPWRRCRREIDSANRSPSLSNRSRTCRNGNWKMASGDWRRKAPSPEAKFQNLPARD